MSGKVNIIEKLARGAYVRYERFKTFTYFMRHVQIGLPDQCWLWKGSTNKKGYGCFVWRRKHINLAHVAAYVLFVDYIPRKHGKKRLFVCHSCDNPPCVNPNHLWLGTNKQNQEDSTRKGRRPILSGENAGNVKLTFKEVDKIREMHCSGKYSYASLGIKFGVTSANIRYIVNRTTWVN